MSAPPVDDAGYGALYEAKRARQCAEAVELLLPPLRLVARGKGYALTLHGSVRRDVDLVAIPWTDEACDAETLVDALHTLVSHYLGHVAVRRPEVAEKPHGRRAYSIHLHDGAYLDLSVMPRGTP